MEIFSLFLHFWNSLWVSFPKAAYLSYNLCNYNHSHQKNYKSETKQSEQIVSLNLLVYSKLLSTIMIETVRWVRKIQVIWEMRLLYMSFFFFHEKNLVRVNGTLFENKLKDQKVFQDLIYWFWSHWPAAFSQSLLTFLQMVVNQMGSYPYPYSRPASYGQFPPIPQLLWPWAT